ncbi:MAG: fructose-1,6-bisphosphatase [Oscillospiraceae bacterium]
MKSNSPIISAEKMQYLSLLAEKYPTIQEVCTEIINLQAILNLPKGTEHFISDVHGEYEAFYHILNNCSGVVREKVDILFGKQLARAERAELCTLIYYPEEKMERLRADSALNDDWYEKTLIELIELCRMMASKYTRSKVRKALPAEFSYIIDELLHAWPGEGTNQRIYHKNIIDTIINIDNAYAFIIALANLVKRLAVDRLHIVGDIFDRGSGADSVMELLSHHHSVDIQWGNHDILWMGAAAGSEACIATVVKNSMAYRNYATLENGYGISLRPLFLFAEKTYPLCKDAYDAAELAISVLLLKLEGAAIMRHPEYNMASRLVLNYIDYSAGTVTLEGKTYALSQNYFPTIDAESPYKLTKAEQDITEGLQRAFADSERLHRHVRFLYANGSMYCIYNQNLLFHGCIPMTEDGELKTLQFCEEPLCGKALIDYLDAAARSAYFGTDGKNRRRHLDIMWYMWCGSDSPLFGRDKMTTFERMFVPDKSTWAEGKDPYYTFCQNSEVCEKLLRNFGIYYPGAHIINGHVPVRTTEGESPVKAGGKLIVIDGGLCKAYQPTTGIAGYTLIYNSQGMRILAHEPFDGRSNAVRLDKDIISESNFFETEIDRVLVRDTDIGNSISSRIYDLTLLLHTYRDGRLVPRMDGRKK